MLRDRDIEVGVGREGGRERESEREREGHQANKSEDAQGTHVSPLLCVYWHYCQAMWLETSAEQVAMHPLTSTVSVQRPLGRNDQTAHWPPKRKSQSCGQFSKNNLDICCLCQCIFAYLHRLYLSSTPKRSSKSLASACPGHHTSRTSKIGQTPAASLIFSAYLICIPRLSLDTDTVL